MEELRPVKVSLNLTSAVIRLVVLLYHKPHGLLSGFTIALKELASQVVEYLGSFDCSKKQRKEKARKKRKEKKEKREKKEIQIDRQEP